VGSVVASVKVGAWVASKTTQICQDEKSGEAGGEVQRRAGEALGSEAEACGSEARSQPTGDGAAPGPGAI
jgi:hypothetical protein